MKFKKGDQEWGTLQYMIVLAVAALIVVTVMIAFGDVAKKTVRDKACLSMMTLKTGLSQEYGPVAFESDIIANCPLYQIDIGEEVEYLRGGEEYDDFSLEKAPGETTEDKVFGIIADEMAHCWDKFGHGQLDAFRVPRNWLEEIRPDWWDNDIGVVGCRTCAEITLSLSDTSSLSGFKEYLQTAKLSSKSKASDDSKPSYYNYLAERDRFCEEEFFSDVENCWEGFAEDYRINTDPTFENNERYLVVFVRKSVVLNEGTLNPYIMTIDTKNRVCQKTLPFK